MKTLYTLLLGLLTPVVLLALHWPRAGRTGAGRWPERLGDAPRAESPVEVWIHAASMGEVQAASSLIDACLERFGTQRVAVTTMTATGSDLVRSRWGGRVLHAFVPLDLPPLVRTRLDRWRPKRCVVLEAELWPNLFAELRRRDIPLFLVNARMSPRSRRRYGRFGGWLAQVLRGVTCVAAQSAHDARHYRELGAPRVEVLGNLKFDCRVPVPDLSTGQDWRERLGAGRPVWAAVSTHEGEERAALDAHHVLLGRLPEAVLILVPRHPQRFDAVWQQVRQSGLRAARRGEDGFDGRTQVLLGDSMGEMFRYLAAADVVFVGGSLVPVGGHNVLEPAALARPVLFGPAMHNFLEARALLLEAGGAVEVDHASALADAVRPLLEDPAQRHEVGQRARDALEGHQGATERVMRLIDAG